MENLRYKLDPAPDLADVVSRHLPVGSVLTVSSPPGSGVEQTLETALRLADHGYRVIPHLPANAVPSPSFLRRSLALLAGSGIGNVLVMAGDGNAVGPYAESLHLMEDVTEFSGGDIRIGIVGHPEVHPHLPHEAVYELLRVKQQLASDLTTQICLNANIVQAYLERLRQNGIHLPIWVGTPGAVGHEQLAAAASRLGIPSSREITRVGPLGRRLFKNGIFDVEGFVSKTGAGFAGSHIGTFNRLADLPQSLLAPTEIGASR